MLQEINSSLDLGSGLSISVTLPDVGVVPIAASVDFGSGGASTDILGLLDNKSDAVIISMFRE